MVYKYISIYLWPIYVIEPELTEAKSSLIWNKMRGGVGGGGEGKTQMYLRFFPDLVWCNQDSILYLETEKESICKDVNLEESLNWSQLSEQGLGREGLRRRQKLLSPIIFQWHQVLLWYWWLVVGSCGLLILERF